MVRSAEDWVVATPFAASRKQPEGSHRLTEIGIGPEKAAAGEKSVNLSR
jgi:hypothetical protein